MQNNISDLEIENFKSIRHIKMDCKRINVLIGRPNVGKSNILEALSLFLAPYTARPFLKEYVRYEKFSNLFYDNDRKNQVTVTTDKGFAAIRYHMNSINQYDFILGPDTSLLDRLNLMKEKGSSIGDMANFYSQLAFTGGQNRIMPYYGSINDENHFNISFNTYGSGYTTNIKNYRFIQLTEFKDHFAAFLRPPHGDNLFTILEGNPALYDEVASFFNKYDLDLVLNVRDEEIQVQKKVDRRVFHTPYFLSADTLQRIIFHLAAIKTNSDTTILLEEPESHSFPPYIARLAEEIIESKENQFFIATHSPYLLMPFIEQSTVGELAVFVVDYKNYETVVRQLTEEELENVKDTEIDLFFNLRAFQE